MKKIISALSILLFISQIACTDEEPTSSLPVDEYVPGELLVSTIPQTNINSAFELINQYNFYIDQASGFEYYSPLPQDSLGYLTHYLSSIPYLNNQGFGPFVSYDELENKIVIRPYFADMNLMNQADWANQINILELKVSNNDFAFLFIKVPVWEEKYWRDELKKCEIVKWAELNYINHTHTN